MNLIINNFLKELELKINTNTNLKKDELDKLEKKLFSLDSDYKNNPKINFFLGEIKFLKLELENAIMFYKKSLDLDPEFINAKNKLKIANNEKLNLIIYLSFINPSSNIDNPIIQTNNKLQKIKYNYEPNIRIRNEFVKNLYKEIEDCILQQKIDTDVETSQIVREGYYKYDCLRHFEVFNTFKVIPKYCFNCYKVQINPRNVLDLIKLFIIFDNLDFISDLTKKCMIELRENVEGTYKGLIYCHSINEAEKIKDTVSKNIDLCIDKNIPIFIKRGCTEFGQTFPDYKELNKKNKNFLNYNEEWKVYEKIIDDKNSNNKIPQLKEKSLNGITLKDAIVIKNWMYYAKKIGDSSYKLISENPTYSNYIDKKVKKIVINKFY